MARYKGGHREKMHGDIVANAATMIRERGLDATSVTEVMRAAGLTHGGFYAHFDDKNAMLAEAMTEAMAPSAARFTRLAALAEQTGDAGVIAEKYLSEERLAAIGDGCAAAALVAELHRAPPLVREQFQAGAQAAAQALGSVFSPEGTSTISTPWGAYAMLVGALALMRAIPDPDLRTELRHRVIQDLRTLANPE
jgi:AcrR family transcriptional regulator